MFDFSFKNLEKTPSNILPGIGQMQNNIQCTDARYLRRQQRLLMHTVSFLFEESVKKCTLV